MTHPDRKTDTQHPDATRIAAVRMALGVSEGDDLDALLGELLTRHAAALEALATAEDVLGKANGFAERLMQPDSHDGPCGPHGPGCDGVCVDNAYVGQFMLSVDDALAAIRKVHP